jgi:hypothetical protein
MRVRYVIAAGRTWRLFLHHFRWCLCNEPYRASGRYISSSGNAASPISTQESEFCGWSCLAITKVHDDQTCAIEDRFIMDTIATELLTAKSYAAPGHLGRTSEIGFVQNVRGENLNIETIPSNPFLPTDRKWAIRFNTGGTVTIVLGMRNYGRGWYSHTSRA